MIAVISDSHVPRRADRIPEHFLEMVEEAELCVHAGDLVTREVLDDLREHADVMAVKGNCDLFELPNSESFRFAGKEFGVYHGTGISPRGHHPTLLGITRKMGVDVLVHGHTHRQESVKKEGKLLINPGSCTGVGGGSSVSSDPTMTVLREEEGIEVEEIVLSDGELKSSRQSFNL